MHIVIITQVLCLISTSLAEIRDLPSNEGEISERHEQGISLALYK